METRASWQSKITLSCVHGGLYPPGNAKQARTCRSRSQTSMGPSVSPDPRYEYRRVNWSGLAQVVEEPSAGLSTEVTCVDHLPPQRGGTVLILSEVVLQDLHHGEHDVQADQICQRQRSDRMTHSQFHDRIDRLARPDALLKGEHGFIDHWTQDAIRDESR